MNWIDRKIEELKAKFGVAHVDAGFVLKLITTRSKMRESDFKYAMSLLLSSKTIQANELAQGFEKIVNWVNSKKNKETDRSNEPALQKVLDVTHPGAKSIIEAFEQERVKLKAQN